MSIYGAISTTTIFTPQPRTKKQKSSVSLMRWTSSGESPASIGGPPIPTIQMPFMLIRHHRGIWALVQATISQIDFDYASYAEVRLGEYWAWRAEVEGTRVAEGREMPLREKRWAQEV